MNILVCGASGFIGSAICRRLRDAGHEVVSGVRRPCGASDIAIDYRRDVSPEVWRERLRGIDVVINAVGIIVEGIGSKFADIQQRAPIALFAACARSGVRRVIQISALGADRGTTRYFTSKYAADQFLKTLPVEWQILRPSLVYGENGTSAAMFRTVATLPLLPIPELADARFQPVHIDDLVEAVLIAASPETTPGQEIDLVGRSQVSYREMITGYRHALGLKPATCITIPRPVMSFAASLAGLIPGVPLTRATWMMLCAGSAGDAAAITRLLGHPPKAIADFVEPDRAESLRLRAFQTWRTPLLRATLAAVWILTALVTLFVHPQSASLELLVAAGLSGTPALLAFYGSAILDLALGIACIAYPARWLWLTQGIVITGYSLIIAFALPEFLSHPFGPILKNLPMLAILAILYSEEA